MAKQEQKKDLFLPTDAAALITKQPSPTPAPVPYVDPAAIPTNSKKDKFMVEKADGSIGQWGNDLKDGNTSAYYRTYSGDKIQGEDVSILQSKYKDDPQVMKLLKRNIAKPGEVPMFGNDDADVIKRLIQQETNPSPPQNANMLPKQIFPR